MIDAPFLYGADKRALFPEAVLLNAIVEKAPGQISKQLAILARPGLDLFVEEVGDGRVRGAAQAAGLFDSDTLEVVGTQLWRIKPNGSSVLVPGTVAGDQDVRIAIGLNADLESVVRIATGDGFFVYTDGGADIAQDVDWTTATEIAGATDVIYHRNDFIASATGTDKVYFLLPAEAWAPLQFASAERSADNLVGLSSVGEVVWLHGTETNEGWVKTGQTDPPYEPYGGLNFDYGCLARGSIVSSVGAGFFIDKTSSVRMTAGGEPQLISTNGICEQISAASPNDITAWMFTMQQHTYYVLNLAGAATWVYDLANQAWSRWETAGRTYWRPFFGVTSGSVVLAFDHESTTIWRLNPDTADDQGEPFSCELMARVENPDGVAPCDNIELEMHTGTAPRAGYGSDPEIQMRYWDDRRGAWSCWRSRPAGQTGKAVRPRWNALGDFDRFRIFHWRVNAPIGRRFTAARMNVA